MSRRSALWLATAGLWLAVAGQAMAEPWLAVREGLPCSSCHVSTGGAGLRTAFGNSYAAQQLPATPAGAELPWTGRFLDRFGFGANARFSARQTEFDDRDDNLDFGVDRVALYLHAEVTDRVSLYLDQQVAPGGSLTREAWARIDFGDWYVKAGELFLPFGWRLEDDTAFVREVTGVNLNQGDTGLEVGGQSGALTWQLAATNGNGGVAEVDDGKLFSTRLALVRPRWQAGVSGFVNDTDSGERRMGGVFLGLETGPVVWLAEYDHIDDRGFAGAGDQQVALLEANVMLARGHNLKLTAEARDFDDDRDERYRYSAVYEYFPWAFTQLRLGVRARDSDDEAAPLNSEEAFLQLHVYF